MDHGLKDAWEAIAGIRAKLGRYLQGRYVSSKAPSDKDLWIWNDDDKKWEPSGSAQVLLSRATSNLDPLTNSFQSITGDGDSSKVRLLLPAIGDWSVGATASFKREAGDPGVMVAALFVNDSGTEETGDARFVTAANLDEGTVGQRWKVTTTAVNTPIELKANSSNSSDALIRTEHTVLAACIGAGGGSVAAASDHGNLDGLGDTADHAWALLADGTRAGSTGSAQDFGSTGIKADVVAESTGAAGVTVDGVKLKDGSVVIANAGYIGSVGDTDAMQIEADGDVVFSQDVAVVGTLGAVGVISAADTVRTDTITEYSGGAGVTVEGVQLEDGVITFTGATGVSIIGFPDNLADALSFEEGGTAYMTFVTTDAGEKVAFGKSITIPDAGYVGSVSDPDAIQIEADGDVVLTQDLAVTGDVTAANIVTQYIKDTGGTTRYTTATSGTWLNRFTGATRFDDNIGHFTNPSTLFGYALSATSATIWYGMQFTLTISGAQNNIRGINASVAHSGTSATASVYGGWYQATKRNNVNSTGNLVAIHAETISDASNLGIWGESRTIEVGTPNYGEAVYCTTTQIGILIQNQYSAAQAGAPTTVYGLKVDDITGGTNKHPIYQAGTSDDANHFNALESSTQLFSTTGSFGSGIGVLGVRDAGTNPSANPANGGILYSDSGAGKWRGSGGTTTTFGAAEPHCRNCGRDFVVEWESPRYGHLIVCMWCASEGMSAGVVTREEKPC